MKKLLAMLLIMVLALSSTVAFADAVNPDDIPDTVTRAA